MKTARPLLLVGLGLALGALLAPALHPRAAGQAAAGRVTGQYAVTAGPTGYVVVIDAESGHCWSHRNDATGQWVDLGSPIPPPR